MIRERSPSASGRKRRKPFRLQPPTITDDMDDAQLKKTLLDEEIRAMTSKVGQMRVTTTC